jgi:hypothetical protein
MRGETGDCSRTVTNTTESGQRQWQWQWSGQSERKCNGAVSRNGYRATKTAMAMAIGEGGNGKKWQTGQRTDRESTRTKSGACAFNTRTHSHRDTPHQQPNGWESEREGACM